MKTPRRALPALLALLALVATAPTSAAAQTDELTLDRETITQYARTHRAMNDARDEFHGKVGRIHDEQGRERARAELEEQIEAILAEHELTQEQYDFLTLAISMDGEARALFEEVMAELQEGTGPA